MFRTAVRTVLTAATLTCGMLALTLLAVSPACRKVEPPQPTPAPVKAELKPAHDATEHAHGSPHGGVVRSTARGHLELIVEDGRRFRVYVHDDALQPRPVAGLEGTVKLALPGYEDVKLTAKDGFLEGEGAPLTGEHVTAVVSVFGGAVQETARFRLHLGEAGAAHRLPAEVPGKKSVIGMITDSTCLLRGEKPAPEHADCAVRCIQNGAPIAIVEEKTGEVFVATAAQGRSVTELLIPFVGQRTEIYGKVFKQGGTQFLVVEDVMPEHQHTPKEGGVVAMMGDLHLELVAAPDGEVRLYLSDDFRKPLPASGRRGTVEVRVDDGPVASKPLLPEPNGAFLAASFPPFGSKAVEVTVRMPLPEDPNYFITFVVEPAGAAPAPKQEAEKPSTEAVITVQGGYKPERVVVKKGVKTKLIFNRMDTGFCSSEVKIPKLGVHEALAELQATVIEITPTEAGEIPYTCGMGMMRGTIVVVP